MSCKTIHNYLGHIHAFMKWVIMPGGGVAKLITFLSRVLTFREILEIMKIMSKSIINLQNSSQIN